MTRVIQIIALCVLLVIVGSQIQALSGSPGALSTTPIVVPSIANRSFAAAPDCPAQAQLDPAAHRLLAEWDLAEALCRWHEGCRNRQCPPGEIEVVRRIIELRGRILELRNRKHALNVSAMEETVAILNELTDRQRQFIFDNRDRAVHEVRESPQWERLEEGIDSLEGSGGENAPESDGGNR